MAELTFETFPPPGPDYPAWADAATPGGAPVVEHARRSASTEATRPRVLPDDPRRDADPTGDDA